MLCRRSSSHNNRRRGMVAAFAAVSFTVLLAAAALSIDGGALLTERRHAQETADAAALAAAADLFQHWPLVGHAGTDPSGTAAKSAQTVATTNGYANDGTTSTVTVNIPPKSGNFTDANKYPGYVEVIVTYNQPPGLSSFFPAASGKQSGSGTGVGGTSGAAPGPGTAAVPIAARAVARGLWVPANPQIIAYNLSRAASLAVVNDIGSISVTNGPVVINSSSASAGTNLTSATFTAPQYDVGGGMSGNFTGPVTSGSRPTPDPLYYLPPPTTDVSGNTLTVQSTSRLNYNDSNPAPNPLPEGIYQGGIWVTGSASLTLQTNGTYYIQRGGFLFESYGSLTGNGVLLYNAPSGSGFQSFEILALKPTDGSQPSAVTLSPLTTGPYQQITIFQQQSATAAMTLSGNGNTNITGTIYAANASLGIASRSYNGQNDILGSQYMAQTVSISGISSLVLGSFPQAKQRIIGLVE